MVVFAKDSLQTLIPIEPTFLRAQFTYYIIFILLSMVQTLVSTCSSSAKKLLLAPLKS